MFKTGKRSGAAKKRITVYSDDPENPKLALSIKGVILVDVESKPRSVVFNNLEVGQKDTKELELKVRKPDEIKITSVKMDNDLFKISHKEGDPKGTSKYDVQFLGSDKVGPVSAKVHIELEGGDKPSAEVFVRAITVGDLKFTRTLYFSKESGAFKPAEIVITSRKDNNIKIKGVEDPEGLLKTKITENNASRVVVKAEIKDSSVPYPKVVRKRLKILTNDKYQSEIDITYMVSDESIRRKGRGGRGASALRALPKKAKPKPTGNN